MKNVTDGIDVFKVIFSNYLLVKHYFFLHKYFLKMYILIRAINFLFFYRCILIPVILKKGFSSMISVWFIHGARIFFFYHSSRKKKTTQYFCLLLTQPQLGSCYYMNTACVREREGANEGERGGESVCVFCLRCCGLLSVSETKGIYRHSLTICWESSIMQGSRTHWEGR